MNTVVAIDGPAASGKSTVAHLLAEKLGFTYMDTGAMYRSFAWHALETKTDYNSRPAIKALIKASKFETLIENKRVVLKINDIATASHIREQRVNEIVSPISTIPELREFLVIRQRQLRMQDRLVAEGRDIGTVVFTDTPYKFFLDADPAIRDARRRQQGQTDATAKRDAIDRGRAVAPLISAADAEHIDTGKLTPQQIVDYIFKKLELVLGQKRLQTVP